MNLDVLRQGSVSGKARIIYAFVVVLLLFSYAENASASGKTTAVEWTGLAKHRILVQVPTAPVENGRKLDVSPTKLHLDFGQIFSFKTPPALSTLQVIRYDPATGKPIPYGKFADGLSVYDLPFRFDFDDAKPREFSFLYNISGVSLSGDLVWTHIQENDAPSYYAIYIDPSPTAKQPKTPSRPYIGDGDALYQKAGSLGTVLPSLYIDFSELTGEMELLVGTIEGYIFKCRNVGTREDPSFECPEFVRADGRPIFVGMGCSPKPVLADWDNDGDKDLIVGAERGGRVLFFENTAGRGKEAVYTDRGEVCDKDGKPIRTPYEPCPELPIYTIDYSSYPEVVDWDGDGKKDLLLGGYVTGYIMFYKNVSPNATGVPVLENKGPIQADGNVLDVCWVGTPTCADLRAAGVLDLVSGSMRVRGPSGGDTSGPALHYFKNTGTAREPKLTEIPFPMDGPVPGGLIQPRLVDWSGDGKVDIILYDGQVTLLKNIGTKNNPRFRKAKSITFSWVPYLLEVNQAVSLGRDKISLVNAASLLRDFFPDYQQQGVRKTETFITVDGERIYHVSKTGDSWNWCNLVQWRKDKPHDMLLGNSQGEVWYYENRSSDEEPMFRKGKRLPLKSGGYVQVGSTEFGNDWATHVGSLAAPTAADFNGDGNMDLMVGYVVKDTDGYVMYFQNLGTNESPLFADGQVVLTGRGRSTLNLIDWNKDGLMDIIAAWRSEGLKICLNEGTKTNPKFGIKKELRLSTPIVAPKGAVCDWDGDGENDLLVTSTYSQLYFFDRWFLENGYRGATLLN
ncbi:MAG: FG-GAP repeat domain-containing protein, partial [Armatimonadota bacterium]